MWVDAHCHLDAFDDVERTLDEARAAGVSRIIVPGRYDSRRFDALLARPPGTPALTFARGLHPHRLLELKDIDGALRDLESELEATGPSAIGECGLDGRLVDRVSMAQQREVLEVHWAWARRFALPIILHVVDATGPALDVLRALGPPPRGGMIHAFGGPREVVRSWTDAGFSLSYGPSITWSRARRPREALLVTPRDRLLFETDAPDTYLEESLTRMGHPRDVAAVYASAARALEVSVHDLVAQVLTNVNALFGPASRGEAGAPPGHP